MDLKTFNDHFMRTTYPIELKLKGLIEWIHKGLYTDFQSILNFYKIFGTFSFKVYRGLLWSCKYPNILKN